MYSLNHVRQAVLRAQTGADQLPDRLHRRPARRSSSIPIATSSSTSRRRATRGRRVSHVTETHIHADFLSGSRELARARPARRCICRTKATRAGSTALPATSARQLVKHGDRITVGNVGARRRAHARPHAGASGVSRDGWRGRERANRARRPATSSSSATSAGPTCSSGPRTSRGRWRRARGRCISSCGSSPTRPDWLQIWPGARRRLGVRQGDQRDSAEHARLRETLQLGVSGGVRGGLRQERALRPAGAAEILRR